MDAAPASARRRDLAAPREPVYRSLTFAQLSRSVTVRLKTSCPARESTGSLMK
jgi:hypothetical protein